MGPTARSWRELIRVAAWTAAWLVVLDVAVGVAFRFPVDGARPPTVLQRYFDYGRSVEGRIARSVGTTNEAATVVAGWLEPAAWQGRWAQSRSAGKLTVAMYGSSFAMDIGKALEALDGDVHVRFVGGPGAPVSHAYAAYGLDRQDYEAPIVVLGVLASAVTGLRTATGLTWLFDSPCPYTYPRFTPTAGRLQVWWPSIRSLSQFRSALADRPTWDAFVAGLRDHDDYYDAFTFEASWLDASTLVRLLRRAWASHRFERLGAATHGPSGFDDSSSAVVLARALVAEFVTAVREDGRTPIVMLLHDQGYSDHLFRLLAPMLDAAGIAYISTHAICPAGDRRNFGADAHFTPDASRRIAAELLGTIRSITEDPVSARAASPDPLTALAPSGRPLLDPSAMAEGWVRLPHAPLSATWPSSGDRGDR